MKLLWLGVFSCCVSCQAFAQVDVEHRRLLTLQSGFAVADGEETISPFGYFWFNENKFPWENTALRVIFGGPYLDAELSCFLPPQPTIAVGIGLGGGVYSDSVTPYVQGEAISSQTFYGDSGNVRVFINHELTKIAFGNLGEVPLNVRATYELRRNSYRDARDTRKFLLPPDFYTQTIRAELRLGGLEPGITARQGLEAYLMADANYRTGFEAFGPKGNLFPAHHEYQRLFGRLAAKIPIERTTLFLSLAGGTGNHLDELSAWRLGGNLLNADPFTYTLHGYYTQEFFARDFGIVNFEVTQQISEQHDVTVHLYADCAVEKSVPPDRTNWRTLPGIGAGVGFRLVWEADVLINYGYGINAVRNGNRGGHEIGVALEKKF